MRIYLALIAVLIVLTVTMAAPGAGVMFTLITLGAGLPLVFSGTLVLYALCALPLVALWSFGAIARLGAAVVVAALVAAAAFAPRAYGRFEAEAQAQALRAADHGPEARSPRRRSKSVARLRAMTARLPTPSRTPAARTVAACYWAVARAGFGSS